MGKKIVQACMTIMPGASHIGGTKYLLMGLNFGEKTDASQSGEPGNLGNSVPFSHDVVEACSP
jgi:hypothetical protein